MFWQGKYVKPSTSLPYSHPTPFLILLSLLAVVRKSLMNQTVLRGFLFCSPAPLSFHSHKEEPNNHALDSPYRDQRQGRAALDARRYRRSSPSKHPRDSSLTSALDSDSDSVLDSTTHFCCGGRKGRNTAQSRTSGSFGPKLKFQYKP